MSQRVGRIESGGNRSRTRGSITVYLFGTVGALYPASEPTYVGSSAVEWSVGSGVMVRTVTPDGA
jgi:hypothetical protein